MSACRACNAPIIWADRDTEVGGGGVARERIALDQHEQIGGTYRIEDGKAVEIPPDTSTLAFKPHECTSAVRRGG